MEMDFELRYSEIAQLRRAIAKKDGSFDILLEKYPGRAGFQLQYIEQLQFMSIGMLLRNHRPRIW